MKAKKFAFAILLLGLIWPYGKAFMSSFRSDGDPLRETPTVPFKGRGSQNAHRGLPQERGLEKIGENYLTPPERTYDYWFKKGRAYLSRKEFEQAIWAFRKALRENPLSQEAHFLLAFTFESRGKDGLPGDQTCWEKLAEKEYRSAIIHGDHLPSRYNLGMLLSNLGRPNEARKEWEHILLVSPGTKLGVLARKALARNTQSYLLPETLSSGLPEEED